MSFVSIELNIFKRIGFLFICYSNISTEISVQINNIGMYTNRHNENRKKKLNQCLVVHGNEMDEFACIDAIEPG